MTTRTPDVLVVQLGLLRTSLYSDGEEDVIFTTEEEKSCTEDDKSSGDEIEEIPEDEESCIEPAEKSIEQIEDNIKEIKEKINNKMNRIEEAFKANDQTGKEKSKVCRITIRIARQEITYLIYKLYHIIKL